MANAGCFLIDGLGQAFEFADLNPEAVVFGLFLALPIPHCGGLCVLVHLLTTRAPGGGIPKLHVSFRSVKKDVEHVVL